VPADPADDGTAHDRSERDRQPGCRYALNPAGGDERTDASAHGFFTAIHPHWRQIDRLVPVRAKGHPAWGEYRRDPATGVLHVTGVVVTSLAGDLISELTHFETVVAPYFGLPRTLD
jgi:RNA polymerase sigma-70 factor (ECF subfamily)